ncbi:hypothetical protein T4D_6629 [Trichinella pseudospiralis]|uniref:Uncharacterized protein n=1 Tax=Trichinella pseudospiralis TaxID=6337 RepID=A0A0V1FLA7_TRIPS|nr:hypothetical protein T4D_6629 [Trichinella pseudospiralis]
MPVDEALLFPKDFEIMMTVACEPPLSLLGYGLFGYEDPHFVFSDVVMQLDGAESGIVCLR